MDTPKALEVAAFICRCQPPHNVHLEIMINALEKYDRLIVLLGSSFRARNIKNPFTVSERSIMIVDSVPHHLQDKLIIRGIQDSYRNDDWIAEVQTTISDSLQLFENPVVPNITLIGCEKDDSSFYLKLFPQWGFEGVSQMGPVNSTDIRDAYFGDTARHRFENLRIPEPVKDFLREFRKTEDYSRMTGEWDFIRKYRAKFAALPYPPMFVTVDAIVICLGHVLIVKRKTFPGKGLLAFPGGFVNEMERIKPARVRELREETKIKVSPGRLDSSLVYEQVFDDPRRSLRGRTITHVGLFQLHGFTELPAVKGSDDAEKAFWMPLVEFFGSPERFFDDHYSMGVDMLGRGR